MIYDGLSSLRLVGGAPNLSALMVSSEGYVAAYADILEKCVKAKVWERSFSAP